MMLLRQAVWLIPSILLCSVFGNNSIVPCKKAIVELSVKPGVFDDETLVDAFDLLVCEAGFDEKEFVDKELEKSLDESDLRLPEKLSEAEQTTARAEFLTHYKQLGADTYKQRQAAQESLQSGTIFMELLQKHIDKEDDPEVSARSHEVLAHWQGLIDAAKKKISELKNGGEDKLYWLYLQALDKNYEVVLDQWRHLPPGYARAQAIIRFAERLRESRSRVARHVKQELSNAIVLDGLTPPQRLIIIAKLLQLKWKHDWPFRYWAQFDEREWQIDALMKTLGEVLCKRSSCDAFLFLVEHFPKKLIPPSWEALVEKEPEKYTPLAFLMLRNGKEEYLDLVCTWLSKNSDASVKIHVRGGGSYDSSLEVPFFVLNSLQHPDLEPYLKKLLNSYHAGIMTSKSAGIHYNYLLFLETMVNRPHVKDVILKHADSMLSHPHIVVRCKAAEIGLRLGNAVPKALVGDAKAFCDKMGNNEENRDSYYEVESILGTMIRLIAIRLRTESLSTAERTMFSDQLSRLFVIWGTTETSATSYLSLLKYVVHSCGVFPDVRAEVIKRLAFDPKDTWDFEPELGFEVLMADAAHRKDTREFIKTYATDVLAAGNGNKHLAGTLFFGMGEHESLFRLYATELQNKPEELPYFVIASLFAHRPKAIFESAKMRNTFSDYSIYLNYDWTVGTVPFKQDYYENLDPRNMILLEQPWHERPELTLKMLEMKPKQSFFNYDGAQSLAYLSKRQEEDLPGKLIRYLRAKREPNTSYSTGEIHYDMLKALRDMDATYEDIRENTVDPVLRDYNVARLAWLKGDYATARPLLKDLMYLPRIEESQIYFALLIDTILADKTTPDVRDQALKDVLKVYRRYDPHGVIDESVVECLVSWGRYEDAVYVMRPHYEFNFTRRSHRSPKYRHVWTCILSGDYDRAREICLGLVSGPRDNYLFDYGLFVLSLLNQVEKTDWTRYADAVKEYTKDPLAPDSRTLEAVVEDLQHQELKAFTYYQLGSIAFRRNEEDKQQMFWIQGSRFKATCFGVLCEKYLNVLPPTQTSATVSGSYYETTPLPRQVKAAFPKLGITKRRGRPVRYMTYVEFRDLFGIPEAYSTMVGFLRGGQGWWLDLTSDDPFEKPPGTWIFYLEHEGGSELHQRVLLPNHAPVRR